MLEKEMVAMSAMICLKLKRDFFCQQRVTFVYVEIKWKENTSRGCRFVSKEKRKHF